MAIIGSHLVENLYTGVIFLTAVSLVIVLFKRTKFLDPALAGPVGH
jgi:hypothetical protein